MRNIKLKEVFVKNLFGELNYNLNFENESGVSIIIGKNGCGKTTLLKLIDFCLSPSYERYISIKSIPVDDVICTLSDGSTIELRKVNDKPILIINQKETINFEQIEERIEEYRIKSLICDSVNNKNFSGRTKDQIIEDIKKEYQEKLPQLLKSLQDLLENSKEIQDGLSKYTAKNALDEADLFNLKKFMERDDVAANKTVRLLNQPILRYIKEWTVLNKCIAANETYELFELGALNLSMREQLVKDKMKRWGNWYFKTILKEHNVFFAEKFLETGRIDASVNFGNQYSMENRTDLDEIIEDFKMCQILLQDILEKHLEPLMSKPTDDATGFSTTYNKYVDAMVTLFGDDSYLALKDLETNSAIDRFKAWAKLVAKYRESFANYKVKAKLHEILNSRQESSKKTYNLGKMFLSNGEKIGISKLSSGEKQNYYMFASLLIRPYYLKLLQLLQDELSFLNYNIDRNETLRKLPEYGENTTSVILIDEPEISWHIEWQEEFVGLVKDICKMNDLQVIMTTHSPHILMDHTDCLVNLNNEEEV